MSESPKLPEEIQLILDETDLPHEKKEEFKSKLISLSITRSFSGPLPPPELLQGYNEVVKGGAERIFSQFEKQSDHRIKLEAEVIPEQLNQSKRGQFFGFVLVVLCLICAMIALMNGYEVFAIVIASTTIVGLAGVFVVGKVIQSKKG